MIMRSRAPPFFVLIIETSHAGQVRNFKSFQCIGGGFFPCKYSHDGALRVVAIKTRVLREEINGIVSICDLSQLGVFSNRALFLSHDDKPRLDDFNFIQATLNLSPALNLGLKTYSVSSTSPMPLRPRPCSFLITVPLNCKMRLPSASTIRTEYLRPMINLHPLANVAQST